MEELNQPSQRPKLIAITAPEQFGVEATKRMVQSVCEQAAPGTVLIQLRSEHLSVAEMCLLGRNLLQLCDAFQQRLVVNDRIDLALTLGVAAVHLKSNSVPAAEARTLLAGLRKPIWLSQAWHCGTDAYPGAVANAVIVSPVFEPRKGRAAIGVAALDHIRRQVAPQQVYALGGVTAANCPSVLGSGVAGVAAVGQCYEDAEALVAALQIDRVRRT